MNAHHASSGRLSRQRVLKAATGPKVTVIGIKSTETSGKQGDQARLKPDGAQMAWVRNGFRWLAIACGHHTRNQSSAQRLFLCRYKQCKTVQRVRGRRIGLRGRVKNKRTDAARVEGPWSVTALCCARVFIGPICERIERAQTAHSLLDAGGCRWRSRLLGGAEV